MGFFSLIKDNSLRYTNYHLTNYSPDKWSYDWHRLPGLEYIPLVSEWEDSVVNTYRVTRWQQFLYEKWYYSIYFTVLYLLMIPVLKWWVRRRGKPYQLRAVMCVWNTGLALFSITGVIRVWPEIIHILTTKGFTASYCQADWYLDPRYCWWLELFTLSKVPELGDTVLLLLKGGELIYLHWVHHVFTLVYTWFAAGDISGTARYMVSINLLAHSLMYTYYTIKSFRVRVPAVISVAITTVQTLQMAFGLYINYSVITFHMSGVRCDCSLSVAISGLVIYLSFLILFLNFFVRTYLIKPKIKSSKKHN